MAISKIQTGAGEVFTVGNEYDFGIINKIMVFDQGTFPMAVLCGEKNNTLYTIWGGQISAWYEREE